MIRSRAFFRPMHRLAMLAALLMVLMPLAGRVFATNTAQAFDGRMQMCTVDGLQWVDSGKISPSGESPPEGGKAGQGDDCAYCSLVGSAASDMALPFALSLSIATEKLAFPHSPRLRLTANWRGLGSRGPPELR